MIKSAIIGAAAFVALAIPAASFAATYEYVNVNGNLETVTANSAEQALTLPTDIAAHSGVLLLSATPAVVTVTTTTTGTSTASTTMSTATSTMDMTATSSAMTASSTAATSTMTTNS